MKNWQKFATTLPDERTQSLEITDVGVIRTVGKKDCLPVNATDVDTGEEHKNLLIPVDADIEFDNDNYTVSGGRLSGSKKSYANAGYKWDIETDGTMTSIKAASAVKA